MNVSSDKPYTIFRKDYKNSVFYKVGLSKKKEDGMYENGYVDIRFKKGIELKNKTQIYLKDAFLSFYLTKDKHTIPYIQVMEWENVSEVVDKEHKDVNTTSVKMDDIEITDDDFPFWGDLWTYLTNYKLNKVN